MKALSKLKAEEGIWMTDVPEPEVGHNDLLIKIRKTAICGTDVHIYNWDEWSQKTIPVPMVVGHEYVGEVVGIGQEVKGFKIGDRVSGEGHITCGHCRNCRGGRTHLCRNTTGVGVNRPGCFAQYLVIPAFNAFKIPDNISDDLASIFDPFGHPQLGHHVGQVLFRDVDCAGNAHFTRQLQTVLINICNHYV
ncbi:alcohol dehydrogenase catalytic domain-containing protein, partial [Citrobacter youngae]|uniref:alcohol dehydrogenase catalytic domain-containing protein n=1 Tax=Citrobacter youngae TaxID=133448 RepID=UPI003EE093CF